MSINPLRQNVPVLCYHQVGVPGGLTIDGFAAHLSALENAGFRTTSLRELHAFMSGMAPLAPRAVVLTFDDCTLDNWVYAIPLLKKHGMRAVFFAVTDFISQGPVRPTMADESPHPACLAAPDAFAAALAKGDVSQFMNAAEIRTAVQELGMEVYSHTRTHRACFTDATPMGTLSDESHWSHASLLPADAGPETPVYPVGSAYAQNGFWFNTRGERVQMQDAKRYRFCLDELSQSKRTLEDITGSPCPFLCWPWGEFDEIGLEAAREAGYQGTLTLRRGPNVRGGDPMRIHRIGVARRKDAKWLVSKLHWHRTWLGATLCR